MERRAEKAASRNKASYFLTTGRLEALSDSIFAFAMTLLVLSFNIPSAGQMSTPAGVVDYIGHFWQEFLFYVLSFIILASYWMTHHRQFHLIRKVDVIMTWLNISLLLLVAMLPFSTNMIGEFSGHLFVALLFNLNIFFISLAFRLMMAYAVSHSEIMAEDCDLAAIRASHNRNWIFPAVALLAVIVSFYDPRSSTLVYLLVPPLRFLIKD